jgi:hypothetical protein
MIQSIVINPFYAIQIDPRLCVEHPPLIDRATWIQANVRAIDEMGAEAWLNLLLDILESGGLLDDTEEPDASSERR